MRIYFLIIAFLCTKINAQIDTAKITSYEHQVMVRVNFDTNLEDFVFNSKSEGIEEVIKISVNNKIKTSLSLDYRIISASVSFAPNFIPGNNQNELKGKSSYTNLEFRFFPKSFIQEVYYKNVKGFYIRNTEDFIPGWRRKIDPYMQFPDLRVQSFGGLTSYVFNKDFSLKGIYTQREWQKVSKGSLVAAIDYDLTIFSNQMDEYESKEQQYTLGLNLGYYYNWVISKKVSIAPYTWLGSGGKWGVSQGTFSDGTKDEKETYRSLTFRWGSGIHIGYNSDRFLYGTKIDVTSHNYRIDSESRVRNNNIYGLIYVGYRFAPPKAVSENYDKIQKKIPIL